MATVSFQELRKKYGQLEVVHGIDLEIVDGEFLVLVGPSGCGKSTCLRMLAGLEDITSGNILIDGRIVNEVEPRERDIAMVFQDYALYPHMSIHDNIAFSLRYRKVPKPKIRALVAETAETLGLTELLDRKPRELSGGQRQRVAMGRAIVRNPKVFLFDEPLSNLDAKLRGTMRLEMKRLHERLKVTTVYVTHDQVEAMTLADRVVIMNQGIIEQVGTPDEVYHHPRTLFVASFIGAPTMNLLEVRQAGERTLTLGDGTIKIPGPDRVGTSGLVMGVRPEDVTIGKGKGSAGTIDIPARVDVVEALGSETLVFADTVAGPISLRVHPEVRPRAGDDIAVRVNLQRIHLFDKQSGQVVQ